jgi:hypothetical protein
MFDPRSREKSGRKKKATQEEAAWRSRRAVEFGHQTVDVLSAEYIIQCRHTSFSLTIRNKLKKYAFRNDMQAHTIQSLFLNML